MTLNQLFDISLRVLTLRADWWVASKITGGATPALMASLHLEAQTHHLSPGLSPGKPNCGLGVDKSLPKDLVYSRKVWVICVQTVWEPWSNWSVLKYY